MKRYEALAHDLAQAIAAGRLRPGERIASVRQTSRSRGVSASTVFQAFYLLEARGLIEARPRSGYFVSHAAARQASGPARSVSQGASAPNGSSSTSSPSRARSASGKPSSRMKLAAR